jgi:hypothetical protein
MHRGTRGNVVVYLVFRFWKVERGVAVACLGEGGSAFLPLSGEERAVRGGWDGGLWGGGMAWHGMVRSG